MQGDKVSNTSLQTLSKKVTQNCAKALKLCSDSEDSTQCLSRRNKMRSCHQKTVSLLVSSDSSDSDSSLQCTPDAGTQTQDFQGLILKELCQMSHKLEAVENRVEASISRSKTKRKS